MKTTWKLQDAKSHFSQVVEDAIRNGPQYVSRRGLDAVVVLAVSEYEALTSNKPGLTEFLLNCPKLDDESASETVFERQKDYPRNIAL